MSAAPSSFAHFSMIDFRLLSANTFARSMNERSCRTRWFTSLNLRSRSHYTTTAEPSRVAIRERAIHLHISALLWSVELSVSEDPGASFQLAPRANPSRRRDRARVLDLIFPFAKSTVSSAKCDAMTTRAGHRTETSKVRSSHPSPPSETRATPFRASGCERQRRRPGHLR
jgi:hypothetical protein